MIFHQSTWALRKNRQYTTLIRMELLFVYGTLKDPKIQEEVIGSSKEMVSDSLDGYTTVRKKIVDGVYPVLIPDPTSSVIGKVISVKKDELSRIDEYETKVYERKQVVLKSGRQAWVYGRFSRVL